VAGIATQVIAGEEMTARNWEPTAFRVEPELKHRFITAVERANPDLRWSDGLRALMRWYLDDTAKLTIALPDYEPATGDKHVEA
jgi:hypothetical protein